MFEIDESLPWTEHYGRYGFAVRRGLVDRAWCDSAVAAVRNHLGDQRPLTEWTADDPGPRYTVFYLGDQAALDSIYTQPGLLAALAELFGDRGVRFASTVPEDPERRHHACWLTPWDPNARRRLNALGHVDSGSPWRGLAFYVSLVDTEPWGGNTTLFPATHLEGHQRVLADPPDSFRGGIAPGITQPHPPYEFVAQAGDVAFVHHLLYHTGNPNSAGGRRPRMAMRVEAFAERPLVRLEPGRPNASPWERSFPVTEPTDLPTAHLATIP